ncbi:MAG: MazG nucleotide pyrophosphohydrolase domain-containing protein [Chloroflexota bacterium]
MHVEPTDPLRDLIRSTLAFYERFGVTPKLEAATLVFSEEVDEFIEAAHDAESIDHIAEEAADVLVTVIGLCDAAGVSQDVLIEQIYAVIRKNDAKTWDTHEINAEGKIARKV